MKKGKVYLVGAGPGDIGLITVKGLEAIKKAEVILYDRLANPKLLDFSPHNCELIFCGKLPKQHTLRQEGINSLLVEKAMEGKTVIRLKGGDPGVFGRVGEEAEALAQAQIEYEIIPGITSGIAAPLYAGIPVTHRHFGESFAVVTAHNKSEDGRPILNWQALAEGIDTIAFYMGVANLPYICQNLIQYGKSPDTPVALIQWGTYGRQKVLVGTLETISQKAADESFSNPAITIVGEIVSVREKLSWFEKKPLFGRQILFARTGLKPSKIAQTLIDQGADVIEFPKWKKEAMPIDYQVLQKLPAYKDILFTSEESAEDFFQIIKDEEIDIRNVRANLYGLSKKTVQYLREMGFIAEVVDYIEQNELLLVVGDSRIGEHHYEQCDTFITSINRIDKNYAKTIHHMVKESQPDTIVFPSAQSVKMFFEDEFVSSLFETELIYDLHVVCMGEKTWTAATFYGLIPDEKAEKPTIDSLIQSINKYKAK